MKFTDKTFFSALFKGHLATALYNLFQHRRDPKTPAFYENAETKPGSLQILTDHTLVYEDEEGFIRLDEETQEYFEAKLNAHEHAYMGLAGKRVGLIEKTIRRYEAAESPEERENCHRRIIRELTHYERAIGRDVDALGKAVEAAYRLNVHNETKINDLKEHNEEFQNLRANITALGTMLDQESFFLSATDSGLRRARARVKRRHGSLESSLLAINQSITDYLFRVDRQYKKILHLDRLVEIFRAHEEQSRTNIEEVATALPDLLLPAPPVFTPLDPRRIDDFPDLFMRLLQTKSSLVSQLTKPPEPVFLTAQEEIVEVCYDPEELCRFFKMQSEVDLFTFLGRVLMDTENRPVPLEKRLEVFVQCIVEDTDLWESFAAPDVYGHSDGWEYLIINNKKES